MKFLLGFIVGVAASFAAYQLDTKPEIPPAEAASQESSEAKTDFTFYENLFDTSVTVLDGVYDQALSNEEAGEGGAGPAIYFVQLGSFSRKESADVFRAEVILEGYMTSDIAVESSGGYHRVVLGPFAHREEASLAMGWAEERLFSSLLVERTM